MNYTKKLIAYSLVTTLVLWLSNYFFPALFVFGRGQIGYWQAILTTAFGLTLAITMLDILVYDFKVKLSAEKYIVAELFVNVVSLYLLAHTLLQNSVGVGIKSFWVASLVGVGRSVAQYVVKQFVDHRLIA
jgi:hypothetical protein